MTLKTEPHLIGRQESLESQQESCRFQNDSKSSQGNWIPHMEYRYSYLRSIPDSAYSGDSSLAW